MSTAFHHGRFILLSLAACVLVIAGCGGGGDEHGGGHGGGHGADHGSEASHSAGHDSGHGDGHGGGHAAPADHASDSAPTHTEVQTIDLLNLIASETRRHDPKAYVEIDLGEFKISHKEPQSDTVLAVRFRLYGVLPPEQKLALEHTLPAHEKRLRDAVITLVQHSEVEQLVDPNLGYLKLELIDTINRVFRARVLKDVAFSDFSLEPA